MESSAPEIDTVRTGEAIGGYVKCGEEADRFIASLAGAGSEIHEKEQQMLADGRSLVGQNPEARRRYEDVWAYEIVEKCNFASKDARARFIGERFVVNNEVDELRFGDDGILAIGLAAAEDAKTSDCASTTVRARFQRNWGLS